MDFWYAVYVKTGDEDNVKLRFEYKYKEDIKFFVPKRELIERKNGVVTKKLKTLFPGYIFINGCLDTAEGTKIKEVPNTIKLLTDGLEPARIPEEEINIFKHLMIDDVIAISNVMIENDAIIVVDGPLLSLKGRIIRFDKRKGRAKVALSFMGEEKVVDLGINLISKIE